MKLNKEFLTHITEEETILVPTGKAGFAGVVRGNETLGCILQLLENEISEEEIIADLKERFEAPEGQIEKDVHNALTQLRSIGAIDE